LTGGRSSQKWRRGDKNVIENCRTKESHLFMPVVRASRGSYGRRGKRRRGNEKRRQEGDTANGVVWESFWKEKKKRRLMQNCKKKTGRRRRTGTGIITGIRLGTGKKRITTIEFFAKTHGGGCKSFGKEGGLLSAKGKKNKKVGANIRETFTLRGYTRRNPRKNKVKIRTRLRRGETQKIGDQQTCHFHLEETSLESRQSYPKKNALKDKENEEHKLENDGGAQKTGTLTSGHPLQGWRGGRPIKW